MGSFRFEKQNLYSTYTYLKTKKTGFENNFYLRKKLG